MCQLMGMSFARPVSADFSLREFVTRNDDSFDGWGLGWYPDQSLAIIKEPIPAGESQHMRFLEDYARLESRLHIAHLREGTRGAATHADTHPFHRELFGRDYCFAHNGTIEFTPGQLKLGKFRPVGNTDSEHVFCHLLRSLAKRGNKLETAGDWHWLHNKANKINALGKLNFLLSDGSRLFAYHDIRGWKGLHYREVRLRTGDVRQFEDETMAVQVHAVDDDSNHDGVNRGTVVATKPLSSTGWQSIGLGELLVAQNGAVVFSSVA